MWNKRQLTKDEAIKFAELEIYKTLNYDERFRLQLFQKLLCMPFDVFHEAAEKTLSRAVFTHEFAFHDEMVKEYLGEKEQPSLDEILNLIPEEKRIIIFT